MMLPKAAIIGMIHLKPLPGSFGYKGSLDDVLKDAVEDAETLLQGGVDALMMENLGDSPYFKDNVPTHTVAFMTKIAVEMRRLTKLPLGINVLRNDALSAVSIASASSADFVRINIHMGARVTDQGIIEGRSPETLRLMKFINAENIKIFADYNVKHSLPLAGKEADSMLEDLIFRGHAHSIILSGKGTGYPVTAEYVESIKKQCPVPVTLGSGVNINNFEQLLSIADYAIIGTALKKNNELFGKVDIQKVKDLVSQAKKMRN